MPNIAAGLFRKGGNSGAGGRDDGLDIFVDWFDESSGRRVGWAFELLSSEERLGSVGPVGKVVDVDPAVGWGVKIGVRNAETLLIKSDLTFPLRLIPAVSKVPSILDEKSP